MAIRRMISRDPGTFRQFQADMITLGKIRTGIYATPAGKRGRPEKLDRFRFTSPDEALIRAVADEYGGEARPWSPDKDPARKEWEVITDTAELEVLIVNGQQIDPTYEAWAKGRTCVRRCDGEWDVISQAPCLCTGPNKPENPQELCKITTRVKVMLRRIVGIGSWMYESHGENFATETGGFMAELVARSPVPVPSMLRLELETRRERNHEKGVFETKNFYVARFRTTAATTQQALDGGQVLAQALTGAPRQHAIEATPVSVPVVPTPPAPFDIEGLRPRILLDIEACTTVEALNAIRDKLVDRGVDDQQVREAWRSKVNAVEARDALRAEAEALRNNPQDRAAVAEVQRDMAPLSAERPYRVLVTGSRTWTDNATLNEQLDIARMVHPGRMVLVHGACPQGADALADTWAEVNGVPVERYPADWDKNGKSAGFIRNQAMVATFPDIVLSFNRGASKGTEHCTKAAEEAGLKVLRFVDDTPIEVPESKRYAPLPGSTIVDDRPEYRVGDTVTVGGIEFTKISDNPFEPGTHAHEAFKDPIPDPVEGTVETTGPVLPDVPEGDYDADELYTMIMTGAGQQVPPLTTAEVNALIVRTTGMQPSRVTGHALAQLRAGLKAGVVAWR